MNSKAMALLAVVVMIASGAVAFVSMPSEVEATGDGSEDSPYDLGTVYVDGSADSTLSAPVVDVKYNQSAYAGLPYKATLSAVIDPTDESPTHQKIYDSSKTSNKAVTIGALKFTPSVSASTSGVISVAVDHADTVTTGKYDVSFKLDVIINPKDGVTESDGVTLMLEPVYYDLVVVVRSNTALTIQTVEDTPSDTATFKQNVDQTIQITAKANNTELDYDSFEWYAYNLPAGLSVYADTNGLYIGGLPESTITEAQSISIYARCTVDNVESGLVSGMEYSGTFKILVTEADEITLSMFNGEKQIYPDGNEFFVMQVAGSDSPITLKAVGPADAPLVTVISVDSGKLVRQDIGATTDPADTHEYVIPVDGAGTYYIEVSSDAGVELLKLNVVINPTGAPGAGFEISSKPSP